MYGQRHRFLPIPDNDPALVIARHRELAIKRDHHLRELAIRRAGDLAFRFAEQTDFADSPPTPAIRPSAVERAPGTPPGIHP